MNPIPRTFLLLSIFMFGAAAASAEPEAVLESPPAAPATDSNAAAEPPADAEAPVDEVLPTPAEVDLSTAPAAPEGDVLTETPPAPPAPAPAARPAAPPPPPPLEGPVAALTLDDVIRDVVYYNPAVEKARMGWLASLHVAKAAWGAYEPDLVAEYNRTNVNRENSSVDFFRTFNSLLVEDKREYKLAVEGRIFSGAAYNAGYNLTRTRNNLLTSVRNEYQSFAGITAEQPLLKGSWWWGASVAQLTVSGIDRRIAFHGFRSSLTQMVYEAETDYWALAFVEEKYKTSTESVAIAQKLVDDSRTRLRVGMMSQLDLVEAEAGLAARLGAQADARQELLDAINRLKLVLSSDKIDKRTWVRTATPMYEPSRSKKAVATEDAVLEEALRTQPEYLVKRDELERESLAVKLRIDQRLPELNLKGSYGYNSLGSTREQSWDKLKDKKHKTWSTGVEFRMPLFLGMEERNLLAAEKYKKRTAEEEMKAAEYTIASSIRTLGRRVEALEKRIVNAREVVSFRRRLLDVELSRMRAGKGNTRIIFDAEEKLSDAKQAELEARVRHREASLQLAVVSGTLLSDRGLETVQDGAVFVGDPALRSTR